MALAPHAAPNTPPTRQSQHPQPTSPNIITTPLCPKNMINPYDTTHPTPRPCTQKCRHTIAAQTISSADAFISRATIEGHSPSRSTPPVFPAIGSCEAQDLNFLIYRNPASVRECRDVVENLELSLLVPTVWNLPSACVFDRGRVQFLLQYSDKDDVWSV